MKLSDKLISFASWLENADNELLVAADGNDSHLAAIAGVLAMAAEDIRETAAEVAQTEAEEPMFSHEKLDEIASLASELDEAGMHKQASVLDDILLTLASPKGFINTAKEIEDKRLDDLKKKYKGVKETLDNQNKIADITKDVKDSASYKPVQINQESLSTRHCPDHFGFQLQRIADNEFQCSLDKKHYNYNTGFTLLNGKVVPPSGVEYQSRMMLDHRNENLIFDTRQQRLGQE